MITLLSHLSHVEIAAPDVEASVAFYEERLGLREVGRDGGKVYLRSWGDYTHHSVVISEGPEPALVEIGWRTTSPEALEEAARRVEEAGVTGEWSDSGPGRGRSYVFTGPWGHTIRLAWDVEQYHAEDEHASVFPDRPEKRSSVAGAPRFLDHVTIAASDVKAFAKWHHDVLGFRIMAYTELDEAPVTVFAVITTNEKSHDLGVVLDSSSRPGRINHYAFWVDTREELLIAADVLMENGVHIEYGPSIHGIGEQSFLYFRDPSGLRIEVNTGGYRNYVPDWDANTWKPSTGSNNLYRNGAMPMSMTESFPPDEGHPTATEEGIVPGTEEALLNPYGKHGQG
ncbi:VOC family protein [Agromyces sp. NPDC004153]